MSNLDRWQRKIEDPLSKIVEESSNLPGAGKPLNLNKDPFAPDDMWFANRLLKDNDLAPAWITEGRELDALRQKLTERIHKAVRASGAAGVKEKLREEIKVFNKRIMTYNLKVPAGVQHRLPIDLEREINRA